MAMVNTTKINMVNMIKFLKTADTIDHLELMFDVIQNMKFDPTTREELDKLIYECITTHPNY